MTDCASFSGFYALFPEDEGEMWAEQADIDKDGRCRAVFSSLMQLYEALSHLAWMVFMIPFLGWTGTTEDRNRELSGNMSGTFRDRNNHSFLSKLQELCDNQTKNVKEFASKRFPLKEQPIISCCSCLWSVHPSLTICTFWLSYSYCLIIRFYLSGKKAISVEASCWTHWALMHTLLWGFSVCLPYKATSFLNLTEHHRIGWF